MPRGGGSESRGDVRHLRRHQHRPLGYVREVGDHLRVTQEQLGDERRRTKDGHQAAGHDAVVPQGAQEPGDLLVLLAQTAIREQSAVGIRGVREPLHERGQQQRMDPAATVVLAGERTQVPERVAGRAEAQGRELTFHGLGTQRQRLGVVGGDRVEQGPVEQF